MPAARYWRIASIETFAGGDLELSEVALYEGATRVDGSATVSSVVAPVSGALSDMGDASFSTSARWDGDAVRLPGFSVVWDFGAGVTKDVTGIGVAGPSKATFTSIAALDYSLDKVQWERLGLAKFDYASGSTMSLFDRFDQHLDKVVLQLGFDEATGIIDASNYRKPVSVSGVNQGYFEPGAIGSRCWRFQGGNSHLQIPYDPTLNFRDSDFCLEGFTLVETGGADSAVLDFRSSAFNSSWLLLINHASRRLRVYDGPAGAFLLDTPTNSLPSTGTWFHWRVSRDGGVARVFINGSVESSATWNPPNTSAWGLRIGRSGDGEGYLYGRVDGIRLTKGASRGVANFIPPSGAYTDAYPSEYLPLRATATQATMIGSDVVGLTEAFTAAAMSALDIYDAGGGRITGTVKEKNTPANTPLKRRVVLLSMPGSRAIRETWSDPETGVYTFDEVAMDRVYTVVSYDHTGIHRGVVADNLVPELMP